MERTLSIIKPDGVKKGVIGKIVSHFEDNGIRVVAMKMKRLSKKEAEDFYDIHKSKPFYQSLVSFMTSGSVVLMVLEGENVVQRNRELMGATDPAKAALGTIRKTYATSVEINTVHGSDSLENAEKEISYFFAKSCIMN